MLPIEVHATSLYLGKMTLSNKNKKIVIILTTRSIRKTQALAFKVLAPKLKLIKFEANMPTIRISKYTLKSYI